MKSNELRIGNIVRQPTTECALKYKEYSIQIAHLLFADMLNPVPITKEWLIKLGAKEQIVCHTCAKINTSKLCYKGQDCGDTQFQRQAEINGLYSDCKELKEKTGHFDLFGFNLFKGKTIQHWSREEHTAVSGSFFCELYFPDIDHICCNNRNIIISLSFHN